MYAVKVADVKERFGEIYAELPACRRERIDHLKNERVRLQAAAAGYLLQAVCGIDEDRDVTRDANGKPVLREGVLLQTGDTRRGTLPCTHFNLSHGGNYAVLALSDAPVGVDVEPVGRVRELVAQGAFTEEEQRFLNEYAASDERRRAEAFAIVWTLKESVMKADGRGLGMDPKRTSGFDRTWNAAYRLFDGHAFACAGRGCRDMEIHLLRPDPSSNSVNPPDFGGRRKTSPL